MGFAYIYVNMLTYMQRLIRPIFTHLPYFCNGDTA